jgi:hypothetical protein
LVAFCGVVLCVVVGVVLCVVVLCVVVVVLCVVVCCCCCVVCCVLLLLLLLCCCVVVLCVVVVVVVVLCVVVVVVVVLCCCLVCFVSYGCAHFDIYPCSEPLYYQMLTTLRGAKSLNPCYVDAVFAIHRTLGLLKGTTMADGEFDDFDPNEYPFIIYMHLMY